MSGQTDDVAQPQRWIGRHAGTLLFTLTALVLAILCTAGQPDGLTTYVLFLILLATSGIAALFGRLVRLPEFGRAFALGGCLNLIVVTLLLFVRGLWPPRFGLEERLTAAFLEKWGPTMMACFWGMLWAIWVLGWRRHPLFWSQVARAAGLYAGALTSMIAAGFLIVGPFPKVTWLPAVLFYVLTTLLSPAVFFLVWLPFWGLWRCWRRLRRQPGEMGSAEPLKVRLRRFLAWPKRSQSPGRWQYTLRPILLIILAVSVGLSWFRVKQEQARRQRETLRVLDRRGIAFSAVLPGSPWLLRSTLGDEAVSEATVWLLKRTTADADLARLRDLNRVNLTLEGGFDDRAMEVVGEVSQLRRLRLSDTRITDAGLVHLRTLDRVYALDLSGTAVTDAGMHHLAAMPSLREVNLSGTAITDSGLAMLRETRLESLALDQTSITNQGLQAVARIGTLHTLSLEGTRITDEGLPVLAKLPLLQTLHLNRTQVTWAGIDRLRKSAGRRIALEW